MSQNKKKKKFFWAKTESGLNGIVMALFLMVILVGFFIYAAQKYRMELYVLEETLETGLHTSLSTAVTAAATKDADNNDVTFEKDLNRAHIIASASAESTAITDGERKELNLVGYSFQNAMRETYRLNDSECATSGIAGRLCSKPILLETNVVIYEPIYQIRAVSPETSGTLEEGGKPADAQINYEATNYVKYTLHYVNNHYQAATTTKEILPTSSPLLYLRDGRAIRGATIEATIFTQVVGINHMGNWTKTSESDTVRTYDISVTESYDIVIAENDDRQQ